MAHFAELNSKNIVTQVVVINNLDIIDENTEEESEQIGVELCKTIYGQNTKWVQTSYNGNIRHNYAGIGYFYDENFDAFIPPKPYNSWIFDQDIMSWKPPVPKPQDDKIHFWDEENQTWN